MTTAPDLSHARMRVHRIPFRLHLSRTAQRGAAALEFALIAVPLMVLVGLIVSLGTLFLIKQNLLRAASEGARAMVIGAFEPGGAALDPCEVARQVLHDTSDWLGAAVACSAPVATPPCAPGAVCNGLFTVRYTAAGGGPGAYTLLHLAPMLARLISATDSIDNNVLSRFLVAHAAVQYVSSHP